MNHLRIAEWLAELLDNKFKIGRFGFGLDPLLNFLPVGGDILALLLGLYIIRVARHMGVPEPLRQRMIRNALIDAVLGFVPVVGTVADFLYKSNKMNLNLLHDWLATQPVQGEVVDDRSAHFAW